MKNIRPKVSVIIPAYNSVKSLPKAINSVLNQSFDDFEIIIINDGSTDGTQDFLAKLKDSRLKIIHFYENKGIGAARFNGVSESKGEYIAFLDADDLWDSEKLEKILNVLSRYTEIQIIFNNYRNINHVEQSEGIGFIQNRETFNRVNSIELEDEVFKIVSGLPEALLIKNIIGTASIVTIRRSVFDLVGNFNPSLSGPEDFEFLFRSAVAGITFAYHNGILTERHKNSQSITSGRIAFLKKFIKALYICESSLRKYDRIDLVERINSLRYKSLLSLIRAAALSSDRQTAVMAFKKSIKYGLSIQALKYLVVALIGLRHVSFLKNIKWPLVIL